MIGGAIFTIINRSHIRNNWSGIIRKGESVSFEIVGLSRTIPLECTVGVFILNREKKLKLSIVPFIKIEGIITNISH